MSRARRNGSNSCAITAREHPITASVTRNPPMVHASQRCLRQNDVLGSANVPPSPKRSVLSASILADFRCQPQGLLLRMQNLSGTV